MSPNSRNWIFAYRMKKVAIAMCVASRVWAQESLTLKQAIERGLGGHPSVEASAAGEKLAEARVGEAKTGLMPRVSYTEGVTSSNNPVFAFGSLLNQRRFSESNFAIPKLNEPGFVTNFQSQVGAQHVIWDGGMTRSRIRNAELGVQMAGEETRLRKLDRVAQIAQAYYHAVLAAETLKAAELAVGSAEADLQRARSVRDAGMATDADVLAIEVHVAAMKENAIRHQADREVRLAELNEAMGAPLDAAFDLATGLAEVNGAELVRLGAAGETSRPELRMAALGREMAEEQGREAKASRLPKISAKAMFEADRGRFVTQAGANWFVGGGLEWNVFDGGAAKQKMAQASHQAAMAAAREKEAKGRAALEVKRAQAGLRAASERLGVVDKAIAQAEETLRIVKNRYEAGLATVTDLLRAELAVTDARTRRLAAVHDQRMAAVGVEYAMGTISGDSNVIQ